MEARQVFTKFDGIESINNKLSGDTMGMILRLPKNPTELPSKIIRNKGGVTMSFKFKRINSVYDQLLAFFIAFALFSVFTLITGKLLDRISSTLFLLLAISGFIAFYNDKVNWRRQSER